VPDIVPSENFINSLRIRSVKMKKLITTIFAIVLAFVLSSSVAAQGLIGFGLKGGLNIANLSGDDVIEGTNSKMGFCTGGFVTYSINEIFSIQPEVLITMKGAGWEEEVFGETLEVTWTLDYLEIPILAKATIPTQGTVKPNLFVGPALGINLRGKAKAEIAGRTEEEDLEDLKSTDFGLVFGAGVDFGLPHSAITLDGRYVMGLSTIDDSEAKADVKNGVVTFMVGYSF
jgi:hypothetical protein